VIHCTVLSLSTTQFVFCGAQRPRRDGAAAAAAAICVSRLYENG